MRQRFGDTKGYRLVVYPDYASLDRPDPDDDRRAAQLHLPRRLGRSVDVGDGRRRCRLVDLSAFDAKAIVGVLRGAPETLGFKPDRRQAAPT